MKKISILVPCCNVEKYVRECLESIRVQTYTNLEIICINDGSSDGTGAIIDEFVAKDDRFTVIHKPNSGYGDSMNKGLDKYTGDYIGIIESDDWIEPDMFDVLLEAAESNDLDIARCCWFEGPTGTENINDQRWVKKNSVYCPLDRNETLLQQPAIWASLYRRELLEEGRQIRFLPTPGASFQDTSFAFKTYVKSKRFMMLDKCLHHYRINPNSSVSSSGKVFCVSDEWVEMIRWIVSDENLKDYFSTNALLPQICVGGFNWNYHRLSTLPRLQFLHRASYIFRQAEQIGIFSLSKLDDKNSRSTLELVMTDPLSYHHKETLGEIDAIFNKQGKQNNTKSCEQKDLISIIIPCYNTSKYISACLTSVIRQSYKNLEIICVDDCSTDDTPMVVRHYMRKDSRISLIRTEKNSGLSASRNMAMQHCKGKYIVFLDGDDYLCPDSINSLYTNMGDDVDVVAGSADVIYEGGKGSYGMLPESDEKYYKIKQGALINAMDNINAAIGIHVSAWGKLWRSDIIRRYNITFCEGLLYEDANFYWKYLAVAPRINAISASTCVYRRHLQGSIMSSTFNKRPGMSIQHILILEDMYNFYIKNNILERGKKVLNCLYQNFFWFAYNNAPLEDHKQILSAMCNILKNQDADTESSPLLKYIASFEDADKAELFMKVGELTGFSQQPPTPLNVPPHIVRVNHKLKKYRRLTKILAYVSSILLIISVVLISWICLYL